jgi:hypothetical protein
MKLLFSAIFLLTSSLSLAECERPTAPDLPDGDTSELQSMVDGQKAVKAYVAGTEAYLDCLTAEDAEAGADESPEADMARVEEHNAAVDEMEKVAAEFNEEIREYKEKAK